MGWEKTLLPRGVALLDVLEDLPGAVPPPYNPNLAWGPLGAKQGSPNHEAESWSIEAARAAVAFRGDTTVGGQRVEQWAAARDVLLGAYFPRELAEGPNGVGLWASEQFCPDSHGGQHLVGPTLSRIAAVLSGDQELLEQSGRLLRTTAQALLCVASPDLQVWAAGMRPIPMTAKGPNGERLYRPPFSGVASEWLRELLGAPHGKALHSGGALTDRQRAKVEANWRSPQYLAVRGLRWLRINDPDDGAFDRTLTLAPCALKLKMTVWRAKAGHLSVIDKPVSRPGGKPIAGVCDWLLVPYPASEKTVQCGFDFQTPAPTPPHNAKMLIFPGR